MNKNRTIGIYHELPNGKIAYSYGFDGINKTIHYYFNNDENRYSCTYKEFDTWKDRKDLKDWPDSTDPVLPYVFDLFYDCKRISQLKRYLINEATKEDIKHINSLLSENGLTKHFNRI